MPAIPALAAKPWLPGLPKGSAFALRTTAAALLALYVAMCLSLDDPKWAAMTVFIVAQADRGMSLVKARNRLAGTFVGAAVGVALTAAFAQAPVLFLVAIPLWVGACTVLATSLSGLRSYAAALAGYTAMIVGMGASSQPLQVFDVAVARTTEITLGILVEGWLGGLLTLPARSAFGPQLEQYIRKASDLCARLLRGAAGDDEIHRFLVAALQFHEASHYAAAASHEVARCIGRLRRISHVALAALIAAQSCHDGAPRPGQVRALRGVRALLERRAEGDRAALRDAAGVHDALARRLRRMARLAGRGRAFEPALERAFVLERGRAVLDALSTIEGEQAAFERREPARGDPALGRHRDLVPALWSGARATGAVLLAAALWIVTAWPSGAGMVTIVGVICALYATRPDPVRGGLGFLKGAGIAVAAALLCDLVAMPRVNGFATLALVLAPWLVLAGLAMQRPATIALGASASIFLIDLVGPVNGGYGEVTAMLNGALALLVGIGIGALMFAVHAPAGARMRLGGLWRATARDLAAIASRPGGVARAGFYGRMADRIRQRLGAAGDGPPKALRRDLERLLAALTLGSAAIDLRALDPAGDRATRSVLRRLRAPGLPGLAVLARRASRRSAHAAVRAGETAGGHWRRAMLLRDMALAAARHPES